MRHALLLDCDGVLAETELRGHLPAFNQTFSELGLPLSWSREEYGRLLAVGGEQHSVALARQRPLEALAQARVVVGDEQGMLRHAPPSPADGS